MSVRRLADDAVQPNEFAFTQENADWAKRKINDYPGGRQASAVIPLLMRAQEQDGWVTRAAIEHIAEMLDMPLIRVLEVATFYTQFQLAPVGKRAHIQVCGTTPCMLRGAGEIMDVCKKHISPNQFEVTADGNLSWEEVECQGACVNAPMIMIFKDTYEDLTPRQMEHIIDRFGAGKGNEINIGPQVDRIYSAPEGGLTSLTEDPVKLVGSKPSPTIRKQTGEKDADEKPARAAKVAETAKSADAKPEANNGKRAKATSPAPSLDDANRPPAIEQPADPDDLKQISGVGPKIEGILNSLGVYKFDQIAKWQQQERDWVDGYLRFKGRIDRDDWVRQAEVLARGGRDEYVRVFGKGPR